jgi:hypothetical protein
MSLSWLLLLVLLFLLSLLLSVFPWSKMVEGEGCYKWIDDRPETKTRAGLVLYGRGQGQQKERRMTGVVGSRCGSCRESHSSPRTFENYICDGGIAGEGGLVGPETVAGVPAAVLAFLGALDRGRQRA